MDGQHGDAVKKITPKVTMEDSMELVEKQYETSQENVTNRRSRFDILGNKVVMKESALSPTSLSKEIDTTSLTASSLQSDVAEQSSRSTGIYASSMTASSMGNHVYEMLSVSTGIDATSLTDSSLESDMVEILPSSAEEKPFSRTQYAAFLIIGWMLKKVAMVSITTRLTGKSSQNVHLEGKSPALPSMGLVTAMAT